MLLNTEANKHLLH